MKERLPKDITLHSLYVLKDWVQGKEWQNETRLEQISVTREQWEQYKKLLTPSKEVLYFRGIPLVIED